MKTFMITLLAVIVLAALVIGFAPTRPAPGDDSVPLTINADRDRYSPIMSSTVGIGLTPAYPSTVDNRTVSFRWQTDYGIFLAWKAPDFKVERLGSDVTIDSGKIYWSYLPEDDKKARPPVQVRLTMIDGASGAAIGDASLEIAWDDQGNAIVNA